MEHSLIKEVNQATQKWLLKVRLVRFSEHRSPEDPLKVIGINFVMLDEEGKSMECTVPGKLLPEYQPLLSENDVHFVHCFEVASAKPKYRLVDHPYMARFTKYTKVRKATIVPDTFPVYACTVLTFAGLRSRNGKNDVLSDTVGLFVSCSHIKMKDTKAGKKPLRNVFISDGSENANVALWGTHAEQFEAEKYMAMSTQGPVSFLFTGLTPGWYNGELSLQASPTASWYVNPTLPEAVELQDRFGFMLGPARYDGQPQMPAHTGESTIEDLSKENNPHDIWGNKYSVTAEIKSLIPNEPWWYMACKKCLHRAKPYGVQYKCTGYECSGTDAEPRYRLGLIVVDPGNSDDTDASSIDLVCFGPVAEELIGTPVQALIDSGAGTQGFLPVQISRLCGRRYQFTLSVPRAALRRERVSFKIDSISVALPMLHASVPLETPLLQVGDPLASGSARSPDIVADDATPGTQDVDPTESSPISVSTTSDVQQTMTLPSPVTSTFTPPPDQTPGTELSSQKNASDKKSVTTREKKESERTKRLKTNKVAKELFPEGSKG